MIKLTQKEKADRFDSLQMAFEVEMKNFEEKYKDAAEKYGRYVNTVDVIGGYNKGLEDAYADILKLLERWKIDGYGY